MTVGEKIRECRTKAGYRQEDLGNLLNPPVLRAAVNKWEGGHVQNIKRTYIEQMADLFHIRPEELMCFDSLSSPLTEEEKELLDCFRALNQEDQRQLRVIALSYLDKDQYRK